MKKIPLLICCVVGLVLLPWQFILPEGEAPYAYYAYDNAVAPATVTKYREELAKQGVQDPRPDDFVILDFGRGIVESGQSDAWWKKDPALMERYANLAWANRRRSYFVRVLQDIYGPSGGSLLRSNAWIIPWLLLLVYGVSYAVAALFARGSGVKKTGLP